MKKKCGFFEKVSFSNYIASPLNIFIDSALLDIIFKCNVNFVFDYFVYYKNNSNVICFFFIYLSDFFLLFLK